MSTKLFDNVIQPCRSFLVDEELWCSECDRKKVSSSDSATGKFFIAYGHGMYEGKLTEDYHGVFFALCPDCLGGVVG
jgi:hypothetical protein